MKDALRLARLCALSPDEAVAELRKPGALRAALTVWGVWVAASMLFTLLKPAGFPEPAMAALPARPPLFWLRVLFWQPVLAAVLVGFVGIALRWLGSGWLALKLASGVAWSVAPFLVSFAYVRGAAGAPLASALLAAWLAATVWYGRRVPAERWRTVAAVVLGLNGVSLLSLLVELLIIPTGSLAAYKALMVVVLLWVLAAAARLFKRTETLSTPRALAAVFFALLAQNVFVGTAFLLKWLPLEVLKVLMYA
ncbi:MAG: hypothetical protein SF051_13285 [Elusimicrobiota bacterium]|nr:hypothetical protein [Elusimicrobiota bacterium]